LVQERYKYISVLGKALFDSNKFDEAIDSYNRAIDIDSKYFMAWYSKGKT